MATYSPRDRSKYQHLVKNVTLFCIEKKKKYLGDLSSVFAPYTFYLPSPLH